MNRLASKPKRLERKQPRVLILTPTRELAIQIHDSFKTYGKHLKLSYTVVFGGVSQGPQVKSLANGVDVLVATPGRLLDLIDQKLISLAGLEVFVLDEADRMLDMGFINDIRKVIAMLPKQRHNLFFSATMPNDIKKLSDSMLVNPVRVEVTPVSSTAELIEQSVMFVDKADKRDLLRHVLNDARLSRVIVFTRTKHGANRVAEVLEKNRIPSEAIHGNKSQNARQRALENFRLGKIRVLVATDIAARGIDIDGVSHVINFEIPNVAESYVHRIGRTARAGADGIAISFCDAEERAFIRDIEKLIGQSIPVNTEHPYHSESVANAKILSSGKAKALIEGRERSGGRFSSFNKKTSQTSRTGKTFVTKGLVMSDSLYPQTLEAVLVGVQLPDVSDQDNASSLDELARLVTTLGYKVIGRMSQRRTSQRGATVLGDGKLAELAKWTGGTGVVASLAVHKKSKAALKFDKNIISEDETESEETEDLSDTDSHSHSQSIEPNKKAQIVIFDCDLSPSQLRNLESASGVQVLDRTGVIIEIFSKHARTKAARLQVEIARLTYVAPRLRETGGGADRQGGGVGGKGAGESSVELDRRKIRDRIKELKEELGSIGQEHLTRRARREQELTVALVGYTNAGKSSLMRALTGSEVLVADKLFATLDTTIRPLHPESRPKVLISDTVGFIKKLPHDLVASFRSTLDEALNASLLLYVVDAADVSFRSQLEVTKTVLGEVGATDVPSLLVLNKKDRLSAEELNALHTEFPDAISISTRDPEDLKKLREKILHFFETDMVDEDLFIPYTVQGVIGEVRSRMRVLGESYDEKGVKLQIRANPEDIARLKARFQLK